MNCRNCGAPLRLGGETGRAMCVYCQSAHLEVTQGHVNGVQLLDQVGEYDCPACEVPLTAARTAQRRIECCEGCGGLLFPDGSFADVVQRRRADYRGGEVVPQPLDPRQHQFPRDCPACRKPMHTHPYYGPGNAVIDSCPDCNLIWLDAGELDSIERAPGRR